MTGKRRRESKLRRAKEKNTKKQLGSVLTLGYRDDWEANLLQRNFVPHTLLCHFDGARPYQIRALAKMWCGKKGQKTNKRKQASLVTKAERKRESESGHSTVAAWAPKGRYDCWGCLVISEGAREGFIITIRGSHFNPSSGGSLSCLSVVFLLDAGENCSSMALAMPIFAFLFIFIFCC